MIRAGGLLLALGFGALPALGVAAETAAWLSGSSLVPVFETAAGPICHHDPARTPTVAGRLLPVCARCTGLYAGAAAGGLLGLTLPPRPGILRWTLLLSLGGLALGLLAAVAEALGLLSTGMATRIVLGTLLGAGIPWLAALGGRLMAALR